MKKLHIIALLVISSVPSISAGEFIVSSEFFTHEPLKELDEKLIEAIKNDWIRDISILINKGFDINIKDDDGYTPLHYAARYNKVKSMQIFIEKGAKIDAKNNCGETPLYCAVIGNFMGNSIEAIKVLIQKGAEIDAKDQFDNTPLHYAASKNMVEIVNILIENGAKIDSKNKANNTPLYCAVYNGYPEAMNIVFNSIEIENIKSLFGLIMKAKRSSASSDLKNLLKDLQKHCLALSEAHKINE